MHERVPYACVPPQDPWPAGDLFRLSPPSSQCGVARAVPASRADERHVGPCQPSSSSERARVPLKQGMPEPKRPDIPGRINTHYCTHTHTSRRTSRCVCVYVCMCVCVYVCMCVCVNFKGFPTARTGLCSARARTVRVRAPARPTGQPAIFFVSPRRAVSAGSLGQCPPAGPMSGTWDPASPPARARELECPLSKACQSRNGQTYRVG